MDNKNLINTQEVKKEKGNKNRWNTKKIVGR